MRTLLLAAILLGSVGVVGADARTDYLLYCRGCHLANGRGVPPVVPTLHDELGKFVRTKEGREYIVRVPGVSQTPMDDVRLAAVLNWVLTEFNATTIPPDFTPYTAEEVGIAREKILEDPLKYRATLVRD